MTKVTWKAGTLLAPVPPALISCGTMDKPNVMTAAWTGIICTEPTLVYVSIRPSRFSNEIIKNTKEFVINIPNINIARAVDWCGVKSGRDINKFTEAKLTPAPCSKINAPQVLEAPISLQCKVKNITNFGTHDMFLAEVVAVDIDDKYINENGALELNKANLLAYAHGFYYTLGAQLGKFGWSVEKNSANQKEVDEKISTNINQNKKKFDKKNLSQSSFRKKFDKYKPENENKNNKRKDLRKIDNKNHHASNTTNRRKTFNHKKSNVIKQDSLTQKIVHRPIKKRIVEFKTANR